MKILLLEDEYTLRKSIKELLEESGYTVIDCSDGNKALAMLTQNHYDLLLSDVNVPGMKGFKLLKTIREKGMMIPAIFITSLTKIDNIEEGFDAGCCDYIKKPFDMAELRLRVASVLKTRVLETAPENIMLACGYEYDAKNFVLKKGKEEIQLSKTEKTIMELFIKNKNMVVTPEMITSYVWDDAVDPANVRVQINNLRKKLGCDLIVNIRGLGYKLEA